MNTRLSICLLLVAAAALWGAAAAFATPAADPRRPDDPDLARWREGRRAALKARALDKSATAEFGLLVIPVDFAGERLPVAWEAARDLAPRLLEGRDSLAGYVAEASRGRLDLRVVLAPLVHLPGAPRDYSDLGLQGFANTRALAQQSLWMAAETGVPFAAADRDGADGLPGSPDDDGEVDGVLILHAESGWEGDPAGLIVPLQFFLEYPVVQSGTAARSYAVASLHSGLGIWAHETAHLFGLDDRYDVFLPGTGEATARGGLGVFSLMAAGARGGEHDNAPALPDAESALQLGWRDERVLIGPGPGPEVLRAGEVWRLPAGPLNPGQWFLLERRGGTPPWDPALPEPRLVVYHVDGDVPDDAQSALGTRHLRVRLVEADGDQDVAAGLSNGDAGDAFTAEAGPVLWDATTTPSSRGYLGPSGVSCTLTQDRDELSVDWSTAGHRLTLELRFVPAPGDTLVDLLVRDPDLATGPLAITLAIAGGASPWGEFAPGTAAVVRELSETAPGEWRPEPPIRWLPAGQPTAGAATTFVTELRRNGVALGSESRQWLWREADLPFSTTNWPDGWEVLADGDTSWHLWGGDLPSPVLACTDADAVSPAFWPEVTYQNSDEAVLVSPPWRGAGRALRIIHALDAHMWSPGLGDDGAVLEALAPDGTIIALEPVGGYPGAIGRDVDNPLFGRPAFIGPGTLLSGDRPLWRADVVPLPDALADAGQLRLRFASDPLWRGRGWLIADLALVPAGDAEHPFRAVWDDRYDGLMVTWAWETPTSLTVEYSRDRGESWATAWEGTPPAGPGVGLYFVPAHEMRVPGGLAASRALVRARLHVTVGDVATPAAYFDPDAPDAAVLGSPAPNPGRDLIRLPVSLPAGTARLAIHDLCGRRIRTWSLTAGDYLVAWDGRDDRGRRLAAGVYIVRLEHGAAVMTRKATLQR
jgi:M6 family metalloprotease-like protein